MSQTKQEIFAKRTQNGKTFDLGDNKFALDVFTSAVHYKKYPLDKNAVWLDIDTTISEDGKVSKAPYDLEVYLTGMPEFHYVSKESGEFDVRLKAARISGKTDITPIIPEPRIEGNRVIWENIYPDTDVVLTADNTQVHLKRLIKSDKAPLEFDVDITEIKSGVAKLRPLRPAKDANGQLLVMEEENIASGRRERLKLEAVEGELQPIVYPIWDNTTIDETVGASNDHAYSLGNDEYVYSGLAVDYLQSYTDADNLAYRCMGVRFQTINIPQGTSPTAAHVEIELYLTNYDDVNAKIYCNDVDDAVDFSSDAHVVSRTRTTEYTSWVEDSLGTGFSSSPDIKSVLEEVFARASWVANNDLAVLFISNTDFNKNLRRDTYDQSSMYAAKLHIEYAEGSEITANDSLLLAGLPTQSALFQLSDPFSLNEGKDLNTLFALLDKIRLGEKEWISPTYYADMGGNWSDEENAYDNDFATKALSLTLGFPCWGGQLVLTHPGVPLVEYIRFMAADLGDGGDIDIDLYDGSWHDIYEGSYVTGVLTEIKLDTPLSDVSYARINFYHNTVGSRWLYEFHFGVGKVAQVADFSKNESLSAQDISALATLFTKFDNLTLTESNWLSGWKKRIKLSIDHDDIDDILNDFPILLHLSASCGRNSDDVSCVFDELTSDANRKKIAVAKGATQCYVEIEKWDDDNEEAWLWVKVPSIASDTDTDLYLYYDADHADNDSYVGDTNDAVAENVWDANFKAVYHMADGADTSHIYDSTGNDNDGTKKGAAEPAVTTSGEIADAQEFDGTDDYVDCGNDSSLDFTSEDFTIGMWVKPGLSGDSYKGLFYRGYPAGDGYFFRIHSNGRIFFYTAQSGATQDSYSAIGVLTADETVHLVVTRSGAVAKIYKNASVLTLDYDASHVDPATCSRTVKIGADDSTYLPYDGLIDEVRVYNRALLPAEIKTSYESERDDLLDWGSEETFLAEVLASLLKNDTLSATDIATLNVLLQKLEQISLGEGISFTALLQKYDTTLVTDILTLVTELLQGYDILELAESQKPAWLLPTGHS